MILKLPPFVVPSKRKQLLLIDHKIHILTLVSQIVPTRSRLRDELMRVALASGRMPAVDSDRSLAVFLVYLLSLFTRDGDEDADKRDVGKWIGVPLLFSPRTKMTNHSLLMSTRIKRKTKEVEVQGHYDMESSRSEEKHLTSTDRVSSGYSLSGAFKLFSRWSIPSEVFMLVYASLQFL